MVFRKYRLVGKNQNTVIVLLSYFYNKSTYLKIMKKVVKKVVVAIISYYAEKTIEDVIKRVPKNIEGADIEILVVDDGSRDRTSDIAKNLGVDVIWQENRGYGGCQKTAYSNALKRGADIVAMVHGDAQYAPEDLPRLVDPLLRGNADVVFGSRMLGDPLKGKMPVYKYVGNKFLTFIENMVLGLKLSEFHCGYRLYSSSVLEKINYKDDSNGFVFDTELIIQVNDKNFKIKEIEIKTYYSELASQISVSNSIKYGLDIFKALLKYRLHKAGIKKYKQFN